MPVVSGAVTDHSGTITAGGTSQQVLASNTSRQYLLVVNVSVYDMWLDFGSAAEAGAGSIFLEASGGAYETAEFVPTNSVNLLCATTGAGYTCKEA